MGLSLRDSVKALLSEYRQHRFGFLFGFVAISLAILAVGMYVPEKYVTHAVLSADVQTGDVDFTQVARDTANTRRLLEAVARDAGVITDAMSRIEREQALSKMSTDIAVQQKGAELVGVSYFHSDQDISYAVVESLIAIFIEESSENKREESAQAFKHIDGQAASYKDQLQKIADDLKAFQLNNDEGSEEAVHDKITQLRRTIESLQFDIDDAGKRMRSIDRQLADEGQFDQRPRQSGAVRERLAQARRNLEATLQDFSDDHPDVLSLRQQIAEMENSLRDNAEQGVSALNSSSSKTTILNPLYDELRKKRAAAKNEREIKSERLLETQSLLQQEDERLQRIIKSQLHLSEMTRDYDVVKNIHEDLLARREKARMSMTLAQEGQGVSYKVHEPPGYPLAPKGLRLMHFMALGPLLGLMLPMILLFLYIKLDSRVRLPGFIEDKMQLPVIAVLPHVKAAESKGFIARAWVLPISVFLFVALVYLAVAMKKLQLPVL